MASQNIGSVGWSPGPDGLEILGDGQLEPLLALGKSRSGLGYLRNRRADMPGWLRSGQGIELCAEVLQAAFQKPGDRACAAYRETRRFRPASIPASIAG